MQYEPLGSNQNKYKRRQNNSYAGKDSLTCIKGPALSRSVAGADLGFSKERAGTASVVGASFLGGCGGMLPQKILKIRVSKMTISSILRSISCS